MSSYPAQVRAATELIEQGLGIQGVTAIEDKLQIGVPDALHSLRKAGMKVWMLTGDKVDTAINIGHSCSLLTAEMKTLRLCADEKVGDDGEQASEGNANSDSDKEVRVCMDMDGTQP